MTAKKVNLRKTTFVRSLITNVCVRHILRGKKGELIILGSTFFHEFSNALIH